MPAPTGAIRSDVKESIAIHNPQAPRDDRMTQYIIVAIGGALGAIARFWVYNATAIWGHKPAWATFGINAAGAFLIGVFFVLLTERGTPQCFSCC
jgi:fluoride ion exporter CrcB/FEX